MYKDFSIKIPVEMDEKAIKKAIDDEVGHFFARQQNGEIKSIEAEIQSKVDLWREEVGLKEKPIP